MKTNYNDFMNDWEELKIKSIEMSHQLSKLKGQQEQLDIPIVMYRCGEIQTKLD